MDDFNELFRKAMETEQYGDTDGDENVEEEINGIMGILGTGELLKLGKAAKDKMDDILKKLVKDLNECEKMSAPSFHSHATVKIQRAAEEIKILNIIILTCTISGLNSMSGKGRDTKDVLDTILKLNLLR